MLKGVIFLFTVLIRKTVERVKFIFAVLIRYEKLLKGLNL